MDRLVNFIMVGIGGAAGSMLRYGATLLGSAINIPGTWSTMVVNIIGSFIIGLVTGCCKEGTLMLLLAVGLCGGFTTFSTFSLQNVRMLQDGKIGLATLYILSTVTLCVVMTWLGYRLGQSR